MSTVFKYGDRVLAKFFAASSGGSWQWFPVMRPGYIPSWMLRQTADKVDELNTNGDVQLMEELK